MMESCQKRYIRKLKPQEVEEEEEEEKQDVDITDEELVSALCEAESLMNSMPLTFQRAHASNELFYNLGHPTNSCMSKQVCKASGLLAPEVDELEQAVPQEAHREECPGTLLEEVTARIHPINRPKTNVAQ